MRTPKIPLDRLKWDPVPEGHKITFRHVYHHPTLAVIVTDKDGNVSYRPFPKKLIGTIAFLWDKDKNLVAEAHTEVSKKDVPNKVLGRCIAHNRVIKSYNKYKKINDGAKPAK